MKNVTLLLLIAASMRAAINDVRVIGVTPTQAIIAYTAPDNGVCTVEVSESATYSPVVKDVNASLFPESSSDNRAGAITAGRSRIFVVGTRDLQTASDGLTYSRSLQNDTQHYFRITCGSDVATGDFRTPPPSFGLSTRDPMMLGAPGQLKAPSLSHTDVNQTWTDPYTGSLVKRLSMPGDQKATYGPYTFPRCALGANWNNTSPCNALTGGTTSYSGSAQDVLGFQFTAPTWSRTFTSDPPDVDWVLFQFLGNCTGTDCSTAAARVLQACLTYDGDACASPWIDLTLPNSPETQIVLCNSAGGATCNLGDIWGAPYTSWGTVSFGDGLVYTSGFSTTLNFTDATDCNRLQVGEQFTILSGRDTTVSAKSCEGSPPSITMASGTTLDPTGTGVAGWPFQYYSGFGYNPRFGVLVRKKSTTHLDATLSIKTPQLALGRSASWSFTSAGEHERCNPNLTSHGNILCEPGSADLFSVDPISGTRHYLGLVIANCCGLQGGRGGETIGPGAVLWDNDGVSLYGSFEAFADPTNKFLVRFTYTGDDRNDNIPSEAQQYLYAPGTFTVMNPTYINDLAQNCSNVGVVCQSGYDKTLFGCNAEAFLVYRYVVLSCQGQQDTYSWMFIYDLGNKLPVGSGGNGAIIAGFPVYKAGLLTSWGVTHNTNNPHDVAAAMVGVKQANDQVPGNNRFYVTLNTSVSSSTTTFLVTSAWNGAWGTQPAGYQTGDPISDAIPGGQHWLQGLAAGDLFRVDDGTGHFEYIRVSTKNSPTSLVVRRGVPWDDCTPPCPSYAWTAGTKLYMFPHRGVIDAGLTNIGGHTSAFWDFLASPKGDDPTKFYNTFLPGGGHQVSLNQYNVGTPSPLGLHVTAAGILASPSAFPMVPANQDFTQQQDLPLFAGKYAPHTGNLYEGHPSLNPVTSRSRPLLLDVHPFIGAGFMSAGGASVAHVSGTLYRIDNYSEGGNFPDGLSRKHFPTLASCGLNPLQDISSAATGNVLSDTSADSYKYCVANAAGECRTGSTAGQIFFNCPYVAPDKRTCTQASQDATDVCIGDFSARGGHHMIYELPGTASTTTDAARLLNRSSFVLLSGLVTKGAANTSNDKMLPFNNWALSGAGGPIFNQPIENVLIKVPRLAGYDSINRASFVPVDVSLGSVPGGTNNVIVEFGYGEHGAPTNFYCATRRETCIAVGATINEATPFYFASETFSGAACSSSCTVAIPAVSGRLVFYRIKYRDAGNVVLATGPTQVVATP